MTVGNPENFKIKIKTGREEIDNRRPCDFNNLTLKKLFSWIDSQQISSALKSELKRSASGFPHQALSSWQNNFEKHLSKAQARLRLKRNASLSKKVELKKEIVEKQAPSKDDSLRMSLPTSENFDEDFIDAEDEERLMVDDTLQEVEEFESNQQEAPEAESAEQLSAEAEQVSAEVQDLAAQVSAKEGDEQQTSSQADPGGDSKEWCEENIL